MGTKGAFSFVPRSTQEAPPLTSCTWQWRGTIKAGKGFPPFLWGGDIYLTTPTELTMGKLTRGPFSNPVSAGDLIKVRQIGGHSTDTSRPSVTLDTKQSNQIISLHSQEIVFHSFYIYIKIFLLFNDVGFQEYSLRGVLQPEGRAINCNFSKIF